MDSFGYGIMFLIVVMLGLSGYGLYLKHKGD